MTGQAAPGSRTTVEVLLAVAGLSPSTEETDRIVSCYPLLRAAIESLHAMEATRYESPGVVFDAAPVFADWVH